MERDIVEARKHMDLSRWEQMPMEKQQVLLAKISHEAKSGDMPPLQYVAAALGSEPFPGRCAHAFDVGQECRWK
jgi:hypothetical protein